MSETLTPIEKSRADTGRRYFKCLKVRYEIVTGELNNARGVPKGVGTRAATLRTLPLSDQLAFSEKPDTVYFSVSNSFFGGAEESVIEANLGPSAFRELTKADYDSLQPANPQPN